MAATFNWKLLRVLFLVTAVIYLITAAALLKRSSWSRALGTMVSLMSIITIPYLNLFGVIIGSYGLLAFFRTPQLFGENRFTHEQLKTEFRIQKKLRKPKS